MSRRCDDDDACRDASRGFTQRYNTGSRLATLPGMDLRAKALFLQVFLCLPLLVTFCVFWKRASARSTKLKVAPYSQK